MTTREAACPLQRY